MNQWITEEEALKRLDSDRDDLVDMVFDGKMRVSAPKTHFKPIDIPRKTKEQEDAEQKLFAECWAKNLADKSKSLCKSYGGFPYDFCFDFEFDDKRGPDKDGFRCLDAIAYLHCSSSWGEAGFLDKPERVSKLVSILGDVKSNHLIRYNALKALLPVLRFNLDAIEPWETDQAATLPPVQTSADKLVRLTPVQDDKWNAREVAEEYIRGYKGPTPSIKEAVNIVKLKLNGQKPYTEKTIRKWIKDLFPPESRKPGRRPKEG